MKARFVQTTSRSLALCIVLSSCSPSESAESWANTGAYIQPSGGDFATSTLTSFAGQNSFTFSSDGVIRTHSTQREIAEATTQLMKVGGMRGGVLFDGIATGVDQDVKGDNIVTFKVQTALLSDSPHGIPKRLTIISPPIGSGGISFTAGQSYRVYAVKINGRYQTWDSTGTYQLAGSPM